MDEPNKNDVLQAISHYLQYLRLMGMHEVPKSTWDVGRGTWDEKTVGKLRPTSQQAKRADVPRPTELLQAIRAEIGDCTRCKLCRGRTNIVFGVGNPSATLMFVGEGPGADEDARGEPFVGRAGQLLNKIIEAMGYRREDVYIGNIVKCRPPQNRAPEPEEIATCIPFLHQQIAAIGPKVIVCLGSIATQALLKTDAKISSLRGNFHQLCIRMGSGPMRCSIHADQTGPDPILVMPTFHPAYLLRNPEQKRAVWEDMQKVMAFLAK